MKRQGVLVVYLYFICAIQAYAQERFLSAEEDWIYTVQPRDCFECIAQKYLRSVKEAPAFAAYNQWPLRRKLQIGQVLRVPSVMLKRISADTEVLFVSGDAKSSLADKTIKLTANAQLPVGSMIETGQKSLVKIKLIDGTITSVQSNSRLTISENAQYVGKQTYVIHLDLAQGRTEISANPTHSQGNQMQVHTPSAIAAVRGTEFRVGAEGDLTLQETLGGRVAFSASGQEVLLEKGYGSVAEKGKEPLSPVQLPAAPNVTGLPAVIDTLPVEIPLNTQADAVAWVSLLAKDDQFTQILDEKVVTANAARWVVSDLPNGQYYLRLRAKGAHNLQGGEAVHAFNVIARPFAPQLKQPENEAQISVPPYQFDWQSGDYQGDFAFQIARDPAFKDVVYEKATAQPNVSLNQTFGTGQYYWRVGIAEGNAVKQLSQVRSFVIQ